MNDSQMQSQSQSQSSIVDEIVTAGIPDPISARVALHATLAVLGARLTDDEANALASILPPDLAYIIDQCEYDGDFDEESFYARVAFHTRRPLAISKEQADVVLGVLGNYLDDARRKRIGRALPKTIAERLVASVARQRVVDLPPYGEEAAAASAPPLFPTSLANGRPGSLHPISDAGSAEYGRHPCHTHSVAANDHPHEDTKLSTATPHRRPR